MNEYSLPVYQSISLLSITMSDCDITEVQTRVEKILIESEEEEMEINTDGASQTTTGKKKLK